ncbi:MAG: M10 family metallopeptidase C-terminal domain-containing protein [Allosphingosinicella sp.]
MADDYAASTATTGTVSVGGTKTGIIETTGDTDWFKTSLVAGHIYQVDVEGSPTGQGTLADAYGSLRNSSGTKIAEANDGGSGFNTRFTYTVPSGNGGTYYVAAGSNNNGTGSYRVKLTDITPPTVTDDYASSTATTGTVSVGGSKTGSIETTADTDWFKASLVAGHVYQVDVEGNSSGQGTLGDPYGSLRNSAGSKVAEADNGGSGLNTRFTYTVPSSGGGTYYVAAGSNDNGTGTYRVRLTDVTPPTVTDDYASNTATAGTVSVGGSKTGNIETTGDTDWFGTSLLAGHVYQVDVEGSSTSQGTLGDPYGSLRNSVGTKVAELDNGGTGLNTRFTYAVPSGGGGTYFVAAGSNDNGTGTYRVRLTDVTPPAVTDDYASSTSTTGTVSVGGSKTGNIETTGDTDWFATSLVAGHIYQVDVEGNSSGQGTLGDPYGSLRNSAGTKVAEADNGGTGVNTRFTYSVPSGSDGTYYVAAGSNNNGTGTYSVRLTDVTATATTDGVREGTDTQHSLVLGEVKSGTIDAEPIAGDGTVSDGQGGMIDKDWYQVTLLKGHIYSFGGSSLSLGTGSVAVSLYDQNSQNVRPVVEGSSPTFTFDTTNQASASQTYYLAVSAGGADPAWKTATGDYAVVYQDTGTTTPPPTADDYRDTATDTTAPLGTIGYLETTRTGKIGPADSDDQFGDKDVFELTLESGKSYLISMTGAAISDALALAQSIFTIRGINSFNTILGTSSEGSNAVLEFYADQGDKYYLRAGAGGASYTTAQGGYRLTIQPADATAPVADPGNTISSAAVATLTNGSYTYSGLVGGPDPGDIFKITTPAAGTLNVSLGNLSADIDLLALNTSGGTIAGPSYNLGNQDEHLSLAVSAGQVVYIKAYASTPEQGRYTLSVNLTAPETPPVETYRTGDRLFYTLAEFARGAYANDSGTAARESLASQGWTFFKQENVHNTLLDTLNWNGIFYENGNAQAVVATNKDALVISFRGTDFNAEFFQDANEWTAMQAHYAKFSGLIQTLDKMISEGHYRNVYVTGHSLGASMVDLYMLGHSYSWANIDRAPVSLKAVTFAHPDVVGTAIPTGTDSRITSFHVHTDIINVVDTWGGQMPGVENKLIFDPVVNPFSAHSMEYYWYGAKFLYDSGIRDSTISAGLDSPRHNDFLMPRSDVLNNTLQGRDPGLLMLGGYGNDNYDIVPMQGRSGETIIEVEGASDWLRLRETNIFGGLVPFHGTARLVPSGRDLLVYPVTADGKNLPYIRIYNHFTEGGRVEFIQWDGYFTELPSDPADVSRWNGAHFEIVTGASVVYTEHADGTLSPFVSATGGAGANDTVSFQPLKGGSVTADLGKLDAAIREGLSFGPQSISLAAAAETETMIPVDIAGMENIIGSDQGDDLTGNDGPNALNGGDGDDSLNGGLGNDYLEGGNGVDTLAGGGGEDLMDGGPGADVLSGGSDSDFYFVDDDGDAILEGVSEGAADRIFASVSYTLALGVYVETLSTTDDAGTDPLVLAGNELDNRIIGNAGANTLYGMGGVDRLEGLAGDDSYIVDNALDVVVEAAGQGYDIVYSPVSYALGAGSEVEVLTVLDRATTNAVDFTGNEFGNALFGNAGANQLSGGAGNDFLDGGAGDDRLDGGADVDTASYDTAGAGVTVSLMLAGTAQDTGGAGVDTLIGIENLVGSAFADSLTGDGGANLLDGRAGADFMRGLAGDDIYVVDDAGDNVGESAGQGIDEIRTSLAVYSIAAKPNFENLTGTASTGQTLTGNANANVIRGGDGNDLLHLWSGGGNDTALGGGGDDLLFFGATLTAADLVDGGTGNDTLILQGAYAGGLTLTANVTNIENLTILAGTNTNVGASGTELYDYAITTNDANFAAGVQVRVNASALLPGEDFMFNGSAEADASFVIYGGRGVDTLTGGSGNDIFFFAEKLQFAPGDTVNGGAGYDSVYFRGNYAIDFNAPGYAGQFNSIESITLTSASDTRYARGGPSEFDYNIKLADANLAAGVTLTVNGTLLQSFETMVVDGSLESDGFLRIFAGASDDILKGGGQADLIHGNLGADTITGGGGADTFRYQKSAESTAASMDHILDFTPGTDKIELTRMDADTNAAGDQAFHWIGANAFGGTGGASAGELRAYQSNGIWFVEGDTNGDGTADLVIALTVQGATPLGAGDFFL